ncbi:MAG TPA: hypothetical protein VGO93_05830 [Candidatus Xenobia bacterium]|jgi:hypothetical protein
MAATAGWTELEASLKQRLEELCEEARDFKDPEPTAGAIQALMGLCQALQPVLAEKRLAMPQVFLKEGGLLELMVPNPPISRRLCVQFGQDGSAFAVSLIDGRGMVDGPFREAAGTALKPAWLDWLAPPR